MTESVIIQLLSNAPGWVILYFVFKEGFKAMVQKQEQDQTIIIRLLETIDKLADNCGNTGGNDA